MRKFLALGMILIMTCASAQFERRSIEPSFGISKIQDVTSFQMFNVNLAVRHMFNTKFGARLDGRITRLYNQYEFNNFEDEYLIQFSGASLQGVVNVGRILNFESFTNNYTILARLGGTYTYSSGQTNDQILHRYSNFHVSYGFDNVVKITQQMSLKASLDVLTGVNNRPFLPNSTETTNVYNINIGVVVSLDRNKEHADWYIEEKVIDTLFLKPTIIDNTSSLVVNEIVEKCNCESIEYVFFDHDSHDIDKDGLDNIIQVASQLNESNKIYLKSYASPPGSEIYNLNLANKRANSVINKLISLGIDRSRILIEIIGEINTIDSQNVDLVRQVELSIVD